MNLKAPVNKAAEDVGEVEGHIEATGKKNGRSYICGWVIDRKNASILLELVDTDGKSHFPETTWHERVDIGARYGEQYLRAGFIAFLSPPSSEKEAGDGGKGYRLYANGHRLKFSPSEQAKSRARRLLDSSPAPALKGCLEKIDGPTLRGWAIRGGAAPEVVTLRVAGHVFPIAVRWRERKDVAETLNIEARQIGFEIDLPGYMWGETPESKSVAVEVFIDGYLLTTTPVQVTHESIVQWIDQLSQLPDGPEQQYQVLLALEHLHYGDFFARLSSTAQAWIQTFADRINLTAYLPRTAHEKVVPEERESFVTLSHWRALRALNERLAEVHTSEQVFDAAVAIMRETGLEEEVRGRYLDSLVPTLCKHDVYARLHEVTEIDHWLSYGEGEDAWSLTIALPAIILVGPVSQATEVLWKLTRYLDKGWINTECIHFAVRELSRQSRAGRVGYQEAEKLLYAVIGVFDALNADWFSRLHDQELVMTAVRLLKDGSIYADYFRRDAVKGVIRSFGLSPIFWRLLQEVQSDFSDPELTRARSRWETLRAAVESGSSLHRRLDELVEPLHYFKRVGNPEALNLLREVVMNTLPELNRNALPAGHALIEMLLEDPAEGVRIAAFPLAGVNRFQVRFPECGEGLMTTLRDLSAKPKSMFYRAQCEAGRLVRGVLDAQARGDREALFSRLESLRAHALRLNEWRGGQLAADLLAFCYEYRSGESDAREADLLISQSIQKAVTETAADAYLPVPAQAALGRLVGKSEQHPLLRAFIQGMRRLIEWKFGDTYQALFERPDPPLLAMPKKGFPRDTLVVVYSCRKYLDSRVEAIRQTWIRDLKRRGIPYLIAVGDGEDTIEGDILGLAVSDQYEDLPKKTLKLIDWVLDHTDFQYLYKIDDDCYLSVARFFDALSYRQHLYYGRIIERSLGSMDRSWHQPKSRTPHAQKVLDKSPEPSIYADGGGGYALSRLAMSELRRLRRTVEGQRLLDVSLMEDKLVGDLLALAGIHPAGEDYESYQRRRTFGAAVPVGMWENTFYPSRVTPTVMTHLDTERHQARVRQIGEGAELWPKKLWPTVSSPRLACQWTPATTIGTNQLELLSDADRLEQLLHSPLQVVAVVRNEMTLLAHFLSYYRDLGVRSFLIVDNLSDDGSREYLLEQDDVALFSADTEYKYSHYGVSWQQALVGNLCLGKWVLLADADEFLVYPDCEHRMLMDFLAEMDGQGADAVRVDMIDMYPYGELDEADFSARSPFACANWFDAAPLMTWRLGSGKFSNGVNFTSGLRHRIDPAAEPHAFVSQKYALFKYKPWMRLSEGIHGAAGMNVAARPAWFAHFKYHAGFKQKVETEIRRGQHFDNAKEYRRYAEILAESQGCFGDEKLSVRYRDSSSIALWADVEPK
ncbi:MAG: glycosyltransferase family 2 protein [Methylohalobius sp. ZOD2]